MHNNKITGDKQYILLQSYRGSKTYKIQQKQLFYDIIIAMKKLFSKFQNCLSQKRKWKEKEKGKRKKGYNFNSKKDELKWIKQEIVFESRRLIGPLKNTFTTRWTLKKYVYDSLKYYKKMRNLRSITHTEKCYIF